MRPSTYGPVPEGWVPAENGDAKVMIDLSQEGTDHLTRKDLRPSNAAIRWKSSGIPVLNF
jgi:hypothetical protein